MRLKKKMHIFKTIVINKSALRVWVSSLAIVLTVYCGAAVTNALLKAIMPVQTQSGFARAAMENIIPWWGEGGAQKKLAHDIFCGIVGFDAQNPKTILYSQISALKVATINNEAAEKQRQAQTPAPQNTDEPRYPIVETSSVVGGIANSGENKSIYVNNETSFDIDITGLLAEKLAISKKDGPLVLIVHTHTTESYTPSGQYSYSSSESTRTQDKNYNVVRVGNVIADELNGAGIKTIHDETINDYPSYNGSYKKTLGIIEGYLEKYPSIQVVLDVHRDGMTKNDGTKMKVCADINGEKAAQVMVLCGSSEGGLQHPAWHENLKLGLRIQDVLTRDYPGLARPLHLVKERYNQHATNGSMILEVGTDGNTLEEALVCGKYTGRAIAKVLSAI